MTDLQAIDLRRVRDTLQTALGVFKKAYSGVSMAAGVKAKCLECSNLQKTEVRDCQIEGCPLWRYRPYRPKEARK
jgi:hypothetical protein